MENQESDLIKQYTDQLATQLRKGLLSYFILAITDQPIYASDIIRRLSEAGLMVVEGTIYPLLSRLQRDGLLGYEWQESLQGPPRKYYSLTPLGREIAIELQKEIANLNNVTANLERKETKWTRLHAFT